MANTIDFILTNTASELISKVLNGKTLNFTRMAVGDGFSYDTTVAKDYTTLVNEVLSLNITKKETLTPSSVRITSAFKNTDAEREFFYREVGLYAQDPDTGEEILYAYGNRNEAAELITPTGSNVINKQLAFIISVGDSANVTFNVNAGVYALQEDLTTLQTNLHELNSTKAKQSDLEVERARINNLATLKEGSTTGDAELADARVDDNGIIHANVGEAFRTRTEQLKDDLISVYSYSYQFIDTSELVYGEYWSSVSGTTVGTTANANTTRIKVNNLKAGHYYWNRLYSDHTYIENLNTHDIVKLTSLNIESGSNVSGDYTFDYPFNIYITYSGNNNTDYMSSVMFANDKIPPYYRKGKFNEYVNGKSNFDVFVGRSTGNDSAIISSAVARIVACNDASESHIYNIVIEDGIYEEKNITLPPYVNLIGKSGIRQNCTIKGYQIPNTSDYNIENTSTINLSGSNKLEHLTITGQNLRYPIHSESANQVKNWTQIVDDCYIEHLGNTEVLNYRIANNIDYSNLWSTPYAWGEGVSSGAYLEIKNSHLKCPSGGRAFLVHEAISMERPYFHKLYNCILESAGSWSAQVSETRDSGQTTNTVIFDSCQFLGGGLLIDGTYPVNVVVSNCGDIMTLCTNDSFDPKHFPKVVEKYRKMKYTGTYELKGAELLKLTNDATSCDVANSDTPIELIVGYAIGTVDNSGYIYVCTSSYYSGSTGYTGEYLGINNTNHKLTRYTSGTKVGYDMGLRCKMFY